MSPSALMGASAVGVTVGFSRSGFMDSTRARRGTVHRARCPIGEDPSKRAVLREHDVSALRVPRKVGERTRTYMTVEEAVPGLLDYAVLPLVRANDGPRVICQRLSVRWTPRERERTYVPRTSCPAT